MSAVPSDIDPAIAAFLTQLKEAGVPSMNQIGTGAQARALFKQMTMQARDPSAAPAVGSMDAITIPGPVGGMPARVLRPSTSGPHPTLLALHGGGHVIGDLDTYDIQARNFTNMVDAVVVALDYRLAPENPWPAAPDDAFAAAEWIFANVSDLGGDASRIGVVGDSAGANLAAVTAQRCNEAGLTLKGQLLFFPITDFGGDETVYPSRARYALGYLLTRDEIDWFALQYIGDSPDTSHPHMSPLHGSLAGLAPAVIGVGECDLLHDECIAYASALADAGVEVEAFEFPGLVHGFVGFGAFSPASAEALQRCCAAFKYLLG